MTLLAVLEEGFEFLVHFGVLFLECVGVTVLLAAAVRSIVGCFRKDPHVRLILAQGIALALEFKLGGEVLARPSFPGASGTDYVGCHHPPPGGADLPDPLGNQERGIPDQRLNPLR